MLHEIPLTNNPRVVIIGGGFAGITIAKKLRDQDLQVVLLDKNNYHTFQPLLYQVATAGLSPDAIAYPLRKIFQDQENFIFRMAKVIKVKPEEKAIVTSIGDINYDYLVIATGSETNFYGMEDVQKYGLKMKSITEALDLRSLILRNFEKALLINNVEERIRQMSIVVVGGGPTGVEVSGALAELKAHVLPEDYPELDTRRMQIHLVELLPRVLGAMSEDASNKAHDFLKDLGVSVWLNTGVKSYDGRDVSLTNGKLLNAKTLIWSAGVLGSTVDGFDKSIIVRGNRIKVDEFNRVDGHENIFAIGDVSAMVTSETPKGHPMVAPVAIQQGTHLSKNIIKIINGKEMTPFKYNDKGSMATVGRHRAVVDLHDVKFQGFFAWFVWLFVHLMYLVGFRNKVLVFLNWIWNYVSYDKAIRLIIRSEEKDAKEEESKDLAIR